MISKLEGKIQLVCFIVCLRVCNDSLWSYFCLFMLICLYVCVCLCGYVSLFICVRLSVCLSEGVHACLHLSVYLSFCLCVAVFLPYLYIYVCLPITRSYFHVCLSCLFPCTFFFSNYSFSLFTCLPFFCFPVYHRLQGIAPYLSVCLPA